MGCLSLAILSFLIRYSLAFHVIKGKTNHHKMLDKKNYNMEMNIFTCVIFKDKHLILNSNTPTTITPICSTFLLILKD